MMIAKKNNKNQRCGELQMKIRNDTRLILTTAWIRRGHLIKIHENSFTLQKNRNAQRCVETVHVFVSSRQ